jgi:hypothetical protein
MSGTPAGAVSATLPPAEPAPSGTPVGEIPAQLQSQVPSITPPKERPPPPTAPPRSIPRTWWVGLIVVVIADLLFAVLSARYGSLLEVESVLAAADVLIAIVALAAIYAAIMFGRSP